MRYLLTEMPDEEAAGFRVVTVDGRERPAYILDPEHPPPRLAERLCDEAARRGGRYDPLLVQGLLVQLGRWLSGRKKGGG